MKKFTLIKKVLAFALAAAMTMGLAACSDNGKGDKTSSPSSTPTSSKDTDESTPSEETSDLVDPTAKYEPYDLGGRVITIANNWDEKPPNTAYVPDPATDSADVLAKLERMKMVEEKYNCKIEYINVAYDDRIEKITSSVMAGAPIADLIGLDIGQILPLAQKELIIPYDDIIPANADVINEQIAVVPQGKLFGKIYAIEGSGLPVVGDCLAVNMDIINSLGLEKDPAAMWESGEWTWDAFMEVAKKATKDTDGDGKIDQWGISGPVQPILEMLTASNNSNFFDDAAKKENFSSKETMEALDMFNKIYNVEKVGRVVNEYADYDANKDAFMDGKSAMWWAPQWIFPDGENKIKLNFTFISTPKGPSSEGNESFLMKMAGKCMLKGTKDPQYVYQIWEELCVPYDLDFEGKREGTMEWLQGKFPTQVDVDRFLKICGEGAKDDASNGIPEYPTGTIVDGIIAQGKTPAQAVEENKLIAQGKIDAIFK